MDQNDAWTCIAACATVRTVLVDILTLTDVFVKYSIVLATLLIQLISMKLRYAIKHIFELTTCTTAER